MNDLTAWSATKAGLLIALLAFTAGEVFANDNHAIADRLDDRGDRIEERLDRRGDRIDDRLDNKGDRIDRRLDKAGHRANHRRSR